MPRGDRTGPNGMGSMSGRGMGFCNGNDVPGFANPGSRMGFRRASGFGRGFGRGFGWRRTAPVYPAVEPRTLTKEEEKKVLKAELDQIEAEKKEIEARMKELE